MGSREDKSMVDLVVEEEHFPVQACSEVLTTHYLGIRPVIGMSQGMASVGEPYASKFTWLRFAPFCLIRLENRKKAFDESG